MPWARYDDELPMNKKIAKLRAQGANGLAALGLHVLCNTWSRNQGTNGHIEPHVAEQQAGSARLGQKLASTLEAVGMFDRHPESGWMVHDFADYSDPNDPDPTRSAADRRRELSEKRAEAGRQGGLAKAAKASSKTADLPDPLLEQCSSPVPDPVPDPFLHESSISSQGGTRPAPDDEMRQILERIATERSRDARSPDSYRTTVLANLHREIPTIHQMLTELDHLRGNPTLAADWYEQSTWKLRGTA